MDFTRLHNPLRNQEAIKYLLQSNSNNIPLSKTKSEVDEGLKPLLTKTSLPFGRTFSHSVGDFLELLLSFDGMIAYSTAIHPFLNEAAQMLPNTFAITPQHSIQEARQQGIKQFIVSDIHDEIFTFNPLPKKQDDEIWIIDITLSLMLGTCTLDTLSHISADGFLIEGELIGLLRGQGAFISTKAQICKRSYPIIGLGEAILKATDDIEKTNHLYDAIDQSIIFFEYLNKNIPQIERFSSYHTLPNTLALRFKGIKARDLITATLHDHIQIANGRRCLFNLGKPSYVLESMGYSDKEQRELIAISFYPTDLKELQRASEILALRYQQVLSLSQ